MKKLFCLCVVFVGISFAQVEHVSVEHKVYDFLERMHALHIIKDYNSFETPISRKQIAAYIQEAAQNMPLLDKSDRQTLVDLQNEFEFDINGETNHQESLFGEGRYHLFSQDPKYLYYYNKSGAGNFFINFLGDGGYVGFDSAGNKNNSVMLGYGGEIRGTILQKFGFFIKATNGVIAGNREAAALHIRRLQYNWNLHAIPPSSFFDETEGYCTADFDYIKIKVGRDRELFGYGVNKLFLSENSPETDFLSLKLHLGILEFSVFHGKVIGEKGFAADSITGGVATVEDKYIGYHRLGLNISKDISLGGGEIIIYSKRSLDLSYLNPFSFYKTVEHGNQDRDNSMLFLDASNNTIRGLKLYGIILFDDIDFSKAGTGWYGNQTVVNLGLTSYNLYKYLPIDLNVEYFRIEPYVFTHRIRSNNFTSDGYNLGLDSDPNSKIFFGKINYRINERLQAAFQYTYRVHGANPVNAVTGDTLNVGGDINLGHREKDALNLKFLEGNLEYYRKASLTLKYEPYIGYYVNVWLSNETNSLQNNIKINTWLMNLGVGVRL